MNPKKPLKFFSIILILIQALSWYSNIKMGNSLLKLSFSNPKVLLYDVVYLVSSNIFLIIGVFLYLISCNKKKSSHSQINNKTEKHIIKNKCINEISSTDTNNALPKVSNATIILFTIAIIISLLLLSNLSNNNTTSNNITVGTKPTSTPEISSQTPQYTFSSNKELFNTIQKEPKKYNGSTISVSGYAALQGYYNNALNSFVIISDKVHKTDYFIKLITNNYKDYMYTIVTPYDTNSSAEYVKDEDKITVTGKLKLEYADESHFYIPYIENVSDITIHR